jgi:periplasmic protein CpxP/Spy
MKKFTMLVAMLLAAGPMLAQQPAAPAPKAAANAAPNGTPDAGPDATAEAQVNQRATQMRAQLKITQAQETAWDAFAQAMRDNVTSTDQAFKERTATLATMSAVDNMKNFAQIEQTRAQGVQNLATAFETLYGGLSDDQKKTADTLFRHYGEQRAARRHAPK